MPSRPVLSLPTVGGQRRIRLALRACCAVGRAVVVHAQLHDEVVARRQAQRAPGRSDARSACRARCRCRAALSVCSRNVMFSPLPCARVMRSCARRSDAVVVAAPRTPAPSCAGPARTRLRLLSGASTRTRGARSAHRIEPMQASRLQRRRTPSSSIRYSAERRRARGARSSPRRRRDSGRRRPSWKTSAAARGCGAKRSVHCSTVPCGALASSAVWLRACKPGVGRRRDLQPLCDRRVCVGAASPRPTLRQRRRRARPARAPATAGPAPRRSTANTTADADRTTRPCRAQVGWRCRAPGDCAGASACSRSSAVQRRGLGEQQVGCCPPCRRVAHRAHAPAKRSRSFVRACHASAVSASSADAATTASSLPCPHTRQASSTATSSHGSAHQRESRRATPAHRAATRRCSMRSPVMARRRDAGCWRTSAPAGTAARCTTAATAVSARGGCGNSGPPLATARARRRARAPVLAWARRQQRCRLAREIRLPATAASRAATADGSGAARGRGQGLRPPPAARRRRRATTRDSAGPCGKFRVGRRPAPRRRCAIQSRTGGGNGPGASHDQRLHLRGQRMRRQARRRTRRAMLAGAGSCQAACAARR